MKIAIGIVAAVLALAGCGDTHKTTVYKTNVEGDHVLSSIDQWSGYCGKERATDPNDVKHAQDTLVSQVNKVPQRTTVAKLVGLPVPTALQRENPDALRQAQEMQVVKLVGTELEFIKTESDGDYHMGLRSPVTGQTMIAESVPPSCAKNSPFLAQITTARTQTEALLGQTPTRIVVTGIRFFDFNHGQTNVATSNAIELHPILSIRKY